MVLSQVADWTVAVTGGASGIGAAAARRVHAAGASVAILDANLAGAEALALELGTRVRVAPCDVVDEGSVRQALDEAVGGLPPVRGLVCCAGVPPLPRTIEETSVADWSRIVDTHLTGTFISCKVIGGMMAAHGLGGAVVLAASVTGFNPGPTLAYGAAKAATINLTKALAVQWAPQGVRVNAVAPGWTDTPFLRPKERGGTRDLTPIIAASPQGRILAPEEIAEVVWFLLSPVASAVTGETIVVDGGILAAAGWPPYGGVPRRA